MLTLAFDTSSKTAAVALLQDDTILYDAIINAGLNHSEVLLPAIDQACLQTRIKITEIDLFACTLGPGSFTGLRIGVSTLKGLMLATGKPACGVSTLAAVALNLGATSKLICSMIDAGRGQVYVAYFRYNDKNILQQIFRRDMTCVLLAARTCSRKIRNIIGIKPVRPVHQYHRNAAEQHVTRRKE